MLFPNDGNKAKIVIREPFTDCPVFVDGLARAGKAVISLAVSTLERAEHMQIRPVLESIFLFTGMGLIDKKAAVDLLIREVNMYLYFGYLGRHIKTNVHDLSSVLNSRDPEKYEKRLNETDSPANFLDVGGSSNPEKETGDNLLDRINEGCQKPGDLQDRTIPKEDLQGVPI